MMRVSDLIVYLEGVHDEHGNLPLVYSSDDEGNSFHNLESFGGLQCFENLDDYFLERIECEEDFQEQHVALCIN